MEIVAALLSHLAWEGLCVFPVSKLRTVNVVRLMRKCHGSDDIHRMCVDIHQRLTDLLPLKIINKLTAASNSSSTETRSVFRGVLLLRSGPGCLSLENIQEDRKMIVCECVCVWLAYHA